MALVVVLRAIPQRFAARGARVNGREPAGIDLAVLYLTFRIVGLSVAEWRVLPAWPVALFLVGMKLSYASVFTALGGRDDLWKARVETPMLIKRLAKASGLRPEMLTARSLFL